MVEVKTIALVTISNGFMMEQIPSGSPGGAVRLAGAEFFIFRKQSAW